MVTIVHCFGDCSTGRGAFRRVIAPCVESRPRRFFQNAFSFRTHTCRRPHIVERMRDRGCNFGGEPSGLHGLLPLTSRHAGTDYRRPAGSCRPCRERRPMSDIDTSSTRFRRWQAMSVSTAKASWQRHRFRPSGLARARLALDGRLVVRDRNRTLIGSCGAPDAVSRNVS